MTVTYEAAARGMYLDLRQTVPFVASSRAKVSMNTYYSIHTARTEAHQPG